MLLLAKSSEKATDNIKYKAIIYFTSQDEVHSETDKDGTIEWSFFFGSRASYLPNQASSLSA